MATYKIHIFSKEHDVDQVFDCPDDTFILDQAEEEGADLPYSCRAGACSSCAGRLEKGEVDQSDQSFLTDVALEKNFILTCAAYPKSDCEIQVHAEDDVPI
uniref:Ferredoxin n=2 Tax=Scytosiphon TaxID=27966 RepID=A0A7T8G4B5_SCYLO|nr:ferredoxin [Scytosiphon promiscuus]YP_010147392.1 ferredoxin [Scytosiphon lomentaria]QDM58292.1 ferredoxin [Scytosiphon promiscuus]QDM58435.1 ferredoxin [Scytosiphon promiscuus]QQP22246.1 ferredoxin [Scytosiphon lomentaria]QTW91534.1 ferredoxin [Scytosiphon lomentaria]WAM64530.1 ferredoxin [Scytosiphon lomentaria]